MTINKELPANNVVGESPDFMDDASVKTVQGESAKQLRKTPQNSISQAQVRRRPCLRWRTVREFMFNVALRPQSSGAV